MFRSSGVPGCSTVPLFLLLVHAGFNDDFEEICLTELTRVSIEKTGRLRQ